MPARWHLKSLMPRHLQHEAKRVDFGLYGFAWIAIDECEQVLFGENGRLKTFTLYLKTPGCVIGPRDNQAAASKPWAYEWQRASADRMMELCNLQTQNKQS